MQRAVFAQAAFASLLFLAPACHRRPTGPSPHYDKGARIYQDLYVTELDDAYLDPRMDEAIAELKLVEPTSLSSNSAQDLLSRIDKGKKEATASRDARQKQLAASQQSAAFDPSSVLRAAPSDAGTGDVFGSAPATTDPYGPGASLADINRDTGGCLVAGGPFHEEGAGGRDGITYKLSDERVCRTKLPGFANQAVLAVNGRIYRRVASSDVRAVPPVLPGSPRTLPDGGAPPATPAATALNPPQGATATDATAPAPSNAASRDTNVAAQQDATPRPSTPVEPNTAASPVSPPPNVAAQQDATPPPAPPPSVPNTAAIPDATPPPSR